MNKKITIIGYGNPLMGDDGLGWAILDELSRLLSPSQNIELICRHQLDIVDAEIMGESRAVIFIDAHVSALLEDVCLIEITPSKTVETQISHISSPDELMYLTRQIYNTAPRAFLCAVKGHDFSLGGQISDSSLALIPVAVQKVTSLIKSLEAIS